MNFEFSQEQHLLREQVARVLKEHCGMAVVRRALDGAPTPDVSLWSKMTELGWHGAAVPEAYGGFGGEMLDLCMIAEPLGRALAPVPFASTQYLFVRALLLAGTETQKGELLPRVASGTLIGTVALTERAGSLLDSRPQSRVENGSLHGRKLLVADGLTAHYAVVDAIADAKPGWYLINLQDRGVQRTAQPVIDPTQPAAQLDFAGAPAQSLQGDHGGLSAQMLDAAATLLSFEQLGGAKACLAAATRIAMDRKAFGRLIGSFQAIKHKLADMYVKIELARANAYYAAWALARNSDELPLAAAAARISAIEAYEYASQENIQTHGGMGYTWEADAHLYYRRARSLALRIGSAREWKERLTRQLLQRRRTA